MPAMAWTLAEVACRMRAIWVPNSSVTRAVCEARRFTCAATTAKPRSTSPARAASKVAWSASRLV